MRWLLGIVAALVIAVVGVAWLVPRLVDAEAVRARVTEAARDALGRELTYDTLEFGVLPPSLKVMRPVVAGESEGDPPFAEADEVALRVSVLPLFWGTVLIDSLVVDGVTVRLVRGRDGLELPTGAEAADAGDAAPSDASTDDAEGGVSLAVSDVELRGATLYLRDEAVSPAVEWELRDLDVTTSGNFLGGSLDVEGRTNLASGGGLAVEGTVRTDGTVDLTIDLAELGLAPFDPYLADQTVGGSLDGRVTLVGDPSAPERLELDLRGADVTLVQGDITLEGPLRIETALADPLGNPSGPFDVDVGDAKLVVEGQVDKAPGIPGRVSGTLRAGDAGATSIDDFRLVLHRFDATGRVDSLAPAAATLDADAFDLAGFDAILPALAGLGLSGSIALEGLSYDARNEALGGTIQLVDLVRSVDGSRFDVAGTLRAEGQDVTSEGLTLTSGDETVPVSAALLDVFGAPRFRIGLETEDAEANRILTAFLGKPDTLYGPLDLRGDLEGAVGGDVLASSRGEVSFHIDNGRLVGVSILKATLERLGRLGAAAVDLGRVAGGKTLQRFYGDDFELFSGTLRVANGVGRTDDLTFRYEGYDVRLRGSMNLVELTLDMQGELTLREEIDAEIAKELGVKDHTPRPVTVPLAAVTGPLGDPQVRLASNAAVRFAAVYATGIYGGDLSRKAEEALPGSGVIVDQVLDGLFGGGRRRAPAPTPDEAAPPAESN